MQANQWDDAGLKPRAANFHALTPLLFLERAATVFADREAVVYGDQRETWSEHALTCRRFAGALFHAGIVQGDGKNVCLRRVDAGTIVQLIARERVTHYSGAPIVHALVRDKTQELGVVFSPAVSALIGGAPPPASLLAAMDALGVQLTHIYGLTETYGPAAICEPQPSRRDLSDSERAARNARQGVHHALQARMAVLTPGTNDAVPADGTTMGEIAFRGNMTMMGYLKDPAASDLAFEGGWFRSGDLAVLEPDGYVRIKDRSKDVIISGGENISSVEVEDVLYGHASVAVAAVVARTDDKWGEVPVAFIELREGHSATESGLVDDCKEHLAHFKCPKQIVFQPIPKTVTGKIQKNVLREIVRQDGITT